MDRFKLGAVAVLATSLCACAAAPPPKTAHETDPPGAAVLALLQADYPASVAALPTTSADIYLGNLNSRVDSLQSAIARGGGAAAKAALAGALYHRFRITGDLADSERARILIEEAIAAGPDAAEARQLHATVLSSVHAFDAAERELAAAVRLGLRPGAAAQTQREIDLALGRYDKLAQEIEHARESSTDFYELAFRANLRVQAGDLNGAGFLFHQAQQIYGDVNPLPLAWVYAQQGIALLRFGHCDAAVRFFEAARERLPQYYLANEHLAECEARLGHLDRARALYGEVVAATGNPEFIGALARVERQAGRVDVADRLTTQAQDGYARLLREQPRAYAQHAAEFYLDAGLAAAALPLARDNLRWRHDVMSYVLLARAALAAGAGAEACTALAGALATPLRPPELSALESSQGDCDRRAAR